MRESLGRRNSTRQEPGNEKGKKKKKKVKYSLNHTDVRSTPASDWVMALRRKSAGGGPLFLAGLALDCQELQGDWGMKGGSEDGGGVAGSWVEGGGCTEMEGSDPLFLPSTSHLARGDLENSGATEEQQSLRAKTPFTQRIINQPPARTRSETQTRADAQRGHGRRVKKK